MSSVLGKDSSGNGNNFAVVNLDATYDVVADSPTKNFPTWNEVDFRVDLANMALSQGNLKITSTTSNGKRYCTGIPATGKWYYEITFTAYTQSGTSYFQVIAMLNSYIWHDTSSSGDRQIVASTGTTNSIPQFATGDVLQIAIDMDNFKQWYGRNNTWITTSGTPNPASGTGAAHTFNAADIESFNSYTRRGPIIDFRGVASGAQNVFDINFGQRDFAYTPPTGFLSVNSKNWPEPTIAKPEEHFNVIRWTGNGGTDHDISGVGFEPDLTWVKNRSNTNGYWAIHDDVRGYGWSFSTHTSSITEYNYSDYFGPFQSDGFRVADVTSGQYYNTNNENYVAWNWKAGTAFSNDASATSIGTIDSSGQVNADAGFSIVKFTGTGSAGTVKHGLSKTPVFMQFRRRAAHNWYAYNHNYHSTDPADYIMYMSGQSGLTDSGTTWNDTEPTSSVFSVGTDDGVNHNGSEHMAYCWTEIEGYSKFGQYEANANADGTFVYTGFTPAMIIIIYMDGTGEWWWVQDWERNSYNGSQTNSNYPLYFNAVNVEAASGCIDFLSNGFKFRSTNGGINNANTYIYMAWADTPFKYANAR